MSAASSSRRPTLPVQPPSKRQFTKPEDANWHKFGAQSAALDFAEPHHAIWAMEKDGSGSRSYIVATRHDFWRRYRTLPAPHRHFYELIRAERPCHLYFDLEYCRHANPDADGEQMVVTLCEALRRALATLLDRAVEGADAWLRVVDLDSSTPAKFSRHLIVRIDGGATAFADNQHCGRLVHAVCVDRL